METKQVYKAIAAVTAALAKDGISKNRRNTAPNAGYNFRGIDDVYNALGPLLAQHSLCVLPRVVNRSQIERTSSKGNALFYTTVEVEFDLVSAEDGSMHTIRMCGEAMDSGDKSSNKAVAAAYKYMALQAFCVPTEGDNDADAATHEIAPARPAFDMPKYMRAIATAPSLDTLKDVYTVAMKSATPSQQAELTDAKDSRKAVLSKMAREMAAMADPMSTANE